MNQAAGWGEIVFYSKPTSDRRQLGGGGACNLSALFNGLREESKVLNAGVAVLDASIDRPPGELHALYGEYDVAICTIGREKRLDNCADHRRAMWRR